ncbi:VOC family virulence protein [Deinococcus sp. Marseille-Q6407]|uniref:VOC family virulence protein n=1 Tax=Deinococcus sp. Marseille-Q6407 TaxID=2969223 RepID=UPI0021BE93BC|nr:VOC family virulence protein [Deinococcus sp. Marseille-Q6407]
MLRLDHAVIHVTSWEVSNHFYAEVLGAEVRANGAGFAYRTVEQQLNVHGPGLSVQEVARLPVQPGNSDLCFEWPGPVAGAQAHLTARGVEIISCPVRRPGAKGMGQSVYFRDPDGSLLEFISDVEEQGG